MTQGDLDPGRMLPPQSREAEAAVVGAMLRDPAVAADAVAVLVEDDFFFDPHRRAFRGLAGLVAAGKPADTVLLFDALRASGDLDDAGGAAGLTALWEATPTAANWEYYAGIVRELAKLRAVIHHATVAVRDAFDRAAPADDVAGQLAAALDSALGDRVRTESATLSESVAAGLADYHRLTDRSSPRAWSGLREIDRVVPGFGPGELIIVGARPGVGKSALSLLFALQTGLLAGRLTLVASLEMSRGEMGLRAASISVGVPGRRFRHGTATPEDLAAVERFGRENATAPLHIDDNPRQKAGQIVARARRLKRRHGQLGLVIVDYLQLVQPDDKRATRLDQVTQITRSLKLAARELDCPVIALSQLNRECENRPDGRPRLSDLRESGSSEQDADVVMLLWQIRDQPVDAAVLRIGCAIDKQRHGPTDTVELAFRRGCTRFEDTLPPL